MHMTSRCIMCSDVDFLCKCLNLLYVIKGDDFLWPGPHSFLTCVCLTLSHFGFLFLKEPTLSLFFCPLITWCLLQYIRDQTPGGIAAKHRCGMHQVHWLGGVLREGVWRRFRTRPPGRDKISWHLLYARNLHPLLWVEHIHYFFKNLKCSLIILLKKKKSLASLFFYKN